MKDIKVWVIVGLLLVLVLSAWQIDTLYERLEREKVAVTRANERTQGAIENWSALLKECEQMQEAAETSARICEKEMKDKKWGFLEDSPWELRVRRLKEQLEWLTQEVVSYENQKGNYCGKNSKDKK